MTPIPLTLLYRYDPERKVYIRVNTHHEISIEEYEEMERQRASQNAFVAMFATALIVIFVGVLIGMSIVVLQG